MPISKDQVLGLLTLAGSLVGIIVYGILLFSLGEAVSLLTLQVTAFLAAASILGVLAWIGYTLATTPPPKPIEKIEKEIEADMIEKGIESVAEEVKLIENIDRDVEEMERENYTIRHGGLTKLLKEARED